MPVEPKAGMVLGGFRLEERVGAGGMGEVWRARNVKSEKFVRAIKVIRADLAADEQFSRRFLHEAEYLEVLQHPNILRVENLGEEHGVLFMVMELLQGSGVDGWLEQKKAAGTLPTVGEACGVISQVLSGVAHAHAHGIIHRDLKPPNYFFTNSGAVKVLDFGIARHDDHKTRVTVASQGVPGSPGYYAPEFSEGKDASWASDIYALGISLFELLTGRWPFVAGGGTSDQATLSLLVQHATRPMPDVRAFRSDVPEALATMLLRAGSKVPEERPTALEFRELTASLADAQFLAAQNPSRTGMPSVNTATPASMPQGEVYSTSLQVRGMGQPVQATPSQMPLGTSLQVRPLSDPGTRDAPSTTRTPPPPSGASGKTIALGAVIFLVFGVGGVFAVMRPKEEAGTADAGVSLDAGVAKKAVTMPDGFALVPAGKYRVGTDSSTPFEGPSHEVALEAFVIGKQEVSVREARAFLAANPGQRWPLPPPVADPKPVANVAHELAEKFCAWKVPGGRLPTEEEWEAAARGPTARSFPWGTTPVAGCANVTQGPDGVSVATDANACGATPEGVLQLLGNVAEWTSSHPSPYPGSAAPPLKVFNEPDRYVIRGGSYDENSMNVSVTARAVRKAFDSERNYDVGFRCVAPWPHGP